MILSVLVYTAVVLDLVLVSYVFAQIIKSEHSGVFKKIDSVQNRLSDLYDGFMLQIRETSWMKIEKRARNTIKKAQKQGVTVKKRVDGNLVTYLAHKSGEYLGNVIVELARPCIFYQESYNTEKGKELDVNSLLLWSVVEDYMDSQYKWLVLGSASHQGINLFKRGFATNKLIVPVKFWGFLQRKKGNVWIIFEKAEK